MARESSLLLTLLPLLLGASLPSSVRAQCAPPPPGAISWWGGDNNALDIVGLSAGTMRDGAGFAPGHTGPAFDFGGVADRVEIPGGVGSFGSAPFSVEFWMNSNTAGYDTFILGKSHPYGGLGWNLRLHSGAIQVVGMTGPVYDIWTAAFVTPGVWYHLALSSSGGSAALYVNGLLEATCPRSTISQTGNPFAIGFTTDFIGGSAFDGLIDEVGIYDRALSAAEISAIHDAGSFGKCRSCSPPPRGMIAGWGGDDNAFDVLGKLHGTMFGGMSCEPGKVGPAFAFNGFDDRVALPNVDAWDFRLAGFSINAWVQSSAVGDFQNIIRYDEGSTGGFWGVGFDPSGKLEFEIAGPSRVGYVARTSGAYSDGLWHFVSAVRDDNSVRLFLYVDGAYAANVPDMGADIIGAANAYPSIGGTPGGGQMFAGLIDEVEIYGRAFRESEIARIFNSGATGHCIAGMKATKGELPGTVVLDFEEKPGTTGHSVYQGTLPLAPATPYTHANALGNVCDVATSLSDGRRATPAEGLGTAGDHYYLVTTHDSIMEGPSGHDSSGREIPPAQSSCSP